MTKQDRDNNGRFLPDPNSQWYLGTKEDGSKYKIGYFDIECSDLKANFGFMLCWTIKTRGKNEYFSSTITKKEIFNGKLDARIVKDFMRDCEQYDLLVGYYSSVFDLAFLRSRAMYNNIQFIPTKRMNHLDLYFSIRGKFATHSKSLKTITKFLGIKGKVDLTDNEWLNTKYGEENAMEKLLKRNRFDCSILEKVHVRMEDYIRFNRNYV